MTEATKVMHTPGPWTLDDPGESGIGMVEGIMVIANEAPEGERLVAECLSPERMEADARLIRVAPDGLAVAERMYLWMLTNLRVGTPHQFLRIDSQAELCALRDFIAAATGRDPEDVQDDFEARAIVARSEASS